MKPQELSIKEKVNYVLKAKKLTDHRHTCHYPGCNAIVKPQFWGCSPHWFALPAWARSMIWATYVPGQELKKNPTQAYLDVAERVQVWIVATETWKVIQPMVAAGNLNNLGLVFHPL